MLDPPRHLLDRSDRRAELITSCGIASSSVGDIGLHTTSLLCNGIDQEALLAEQPFDDS